MDYISPAKLLEEVSHYGDKKSKLSVAAMLLKGFLAGALLAYATAFAYRSTEGLAGGAASLVAAAVFPVGFAMIVLLGLELVTGNFAVVPVALVRGHGSGAALMRNWLWVFLGNFLGSIFVGGLLAFALTEGFHEPAGALGAKIIAVAQSKTLTYEHVGAAGWATAFVKAVLCNWMVAMGTVLGMSSSSTLGKITATWLPIMMFFGLQLEHSVVNMFVIPTAIMLGADISIPQWWIWNQIPVTLGNIVGGAVLTGLLLHFIDRASSARSAPSLAADAMAATAPQAAPPG